MPFIKYPSHINHYKTSDILRVANNLPPDTLFVATEKVDGANFQIILEPDGTINFASRSQTLGQFSSFFNYQEAVSKIMPQLRELSEYCVKLNYSVNLFGELYSSSINKRIPYRDGVNFVAFDVYTNGERLSHTGLEALCNVYRIPRIRPYATGTLSELLKLNPNDFKSHYADSGIIEGFVIRPYYTPSDFTIKLKHEQFSDTKASGDKVSHTRVTVPQHITDAISSRINDNRLLDTMSKFGHDEPLDNVFRLVFDEVMEEVNNELEDKGEDTLSVKDFKWAFKPFAGVVYKGVIRLRG